MVNVFIVDDEPLARDELRYLLEQTNLVQVIGESDHIEDLMKEDIIDEVDCVFLDIELGTENGWN